MTERRALGVVAALNLAWLAAELWAGIAAGSAALIADCADLAADGLIALLALAAWRGAHRAVAMLIAAPALVALSRALSAALSPFEPWPPDARTMVAMGCGALAVNLAAAVALAAAKPGGATGKAVLAASWADAAISSLVVFAGLATMSVRSAWIDLALGCAIALIGLHAARDAWKADEAG